MKPPFSLLISFMFMLALALPSFALDQCGAISCDCDSLPTDSWKSSCRNQEARIVADCFKNPENEVGYCSLHGPKANALPLSLHVEKVSAVSLDEAAKLNNKVAVLYWSLYKGVDALTAAIKAKKIDQANKVVGTFEHNLDMLFVTQQIVAYSLSSNKQESKAQLTWREYSGDNLSVSTEVFVAAESLLNNYGSIENTAERKKMHALGLRLMFLSGKMYEQVGYAYSQGQRHKHAARAWKNASNASAVAMAHAMDQDNTLANSDFYRMQSASRLHRASYHWVIGSGKGSAEESLAESQQFMDDKSSLRSVVDEERQLQKAKPSWYK